jgi:multidrug efflux system outer membrane protein
MRNTLQNRFGTRSAWILLLSASMLSGCTVGPNYHRPAVQTPPAFHGPEQSQQTEPQTASFADLPWWQVFQDPQLQELIRTALKQNYDLQLAVERVNAASVKGGVKPSQWGGVRIGHWIAV